MNDFDTKLNNILLDMAIRLLEMPVLETNIGTPIDKAKNDILELIDNELKNVVYAKFGPKDE